MPFISFSCHILNSVKIAVAKADVLVLFFILGEKAYNLLLLSMMLACKFLIDALCNIESPTIAILLSIFTIEGCWIFVKYFSYVCSEDYVCFSLLFY